MSEFSQVIDNFPYPIAIFEHSGVLIMANRTMARAAGIRSEDVEDKRINILNRITTENADMLEAVERAFLGETTLLPDLVEPLTIFAGEGIPADCGDDYRSAVCFPVFASCEAVSHGAVMLMKKNL